MRFIVGWSSCDKAFDDGAYIRNARIKERHWYKGELVHKSDTYQNGGMILLTMYRSWASLALQILLRNVARRPNGNIKASNTSTPEAPSICM